MCVPVSNHSSRAAAISTESSARSPHDLGITNHHKETVMITQGEFEYAYASRSGITIEEYRASFIALPCGCTDEACEGWSSVSRDPDAIAEHLDFYAPGAPRSMPVGRFRALGYPVKVSSGNFPLDTVISCDGCGRAMPTDVGLNVCLCGVGKVIIGKTITN